MADLDREELRGAEQRKLITALQAAVVYCRLQGVSEGLFAGMLNEAELGLVPAKLATTANLLKAMVGYDPLATDDLPEEGREPKPRITSYNVCYTKLLRQRQQD